MGKKSTICFSFSKLVPILSCLVGFLFGVLIGGRFLFGDCDSFQGSTAVRTISKVDADATPSLLRAERAKLYLRRAEKSGESGDGNEAFRNLLAANDLDPTNLDYMFNLVENYIDANYADLALDELDSALRRFNDEAEDKDASNLKVELEAMKKDLVTRVPLLSDREQLLAARRHSSKLSSSEKPTSSTNLPRANLLFPFSTAVQKHDLSPIITTNMNEKFYDATLQLYQQMLKEKPELKKESSTEINHKFFNYQMKILNDTGDYWQGFRKQPLYRILVESMREATVEFLQLHGWTREDSIDRAARHLVFWLSVHDADSEHEPHVTEDALVGGVYYVALGNTHPQLLELYDPRGKQPFGLNEKNAKRLPSAPFHRTVTVTPHTGLLVLFPGWLVHAVMPRDAMEEGVVDQQRPFRVSVSCNLKGEWQDTSNLIISN